MLSTRSRGPSPKPPSPGPRPSTSTVFSDASYRHWLLRAPRDGRGSRRPPSRPIARALIVAALILSHRFHQYLPWLSFTIHIHPFAFLFVLSFFDVPLSFTAPFSSYPDGPHLHRPWPSSSPSPLPHVVAVPVIQRHVSISIRIALHFLPLIPPLTESSSPSLDSRLYPSLYFPALCCPRFAQRAPRPRRLAPILSTHRLPAPAPGARRASRSRHHLHPPPSACPSCTSLSCASPSLIPRALLHPVPSLPVPPRLPDHWRAHAVCALLPSSKSSPGLSRILAPVNARANRHPARVHPGAAPRLSSLARALYLCAVSHHHRPRPRPGPTSESPRSQIDMKVLKFNRHPSSPNSMPVPALKVCRISNPHQRARSIANHYHTPGARNPSLESPRLANARARKRRFKSWAFESIAPAPNSTRISNRIQGSNLVLASLRLKSPRSQTQVPADAPRLRRARTRAHANAGERGFGL
ncbi:hypothetical protein DFH09DRAFT_1338973 [Mycena vulgaris]|nr:hypothetical protein DFH09DRAFT_1338973 [Mycena vulgaris]